MLFKRKHKNLERFHGDYRERYVRRVYWTYRAGFLLGVLLAALAALADYLGLFD